MQDNLRHVEYTTKGVCARMISFDLDEKNNIHNLGFSQPGSLSPRSVALSSYRAPHGNAEEYGNNPFAVVTD